MTIIRAACTDCGQIDLPPAAVSLARCVNRASLSTYSFTCPTCSVPQIRNATEQHCAALGVGGVHVTYWSVPAEALEPHRGEVITEDDVITFGLGLERELAALLDGAK